MGQADIGRVLRVSLPPRASDRLSARQRRILIDAFGAAVARVQPDSSICRYLPEPTARGKLIVLAAGKAAVRMAQVAEKHYLSMLPSERLSGIVVTPHHADTALRRLECVTASHPLPDETSVDAAERVIEAVSGLDAGDRVVMLLSGGASALLCAPAPGISLAQVRRITETLLASGASIDEINAVRKATSSIQGGKLATLAEPATVTTLAISDVVGDDPAVIGSAPTVHSAPARETVRDIAERYRLTIPPAVIEAIPTAAPERTEHNDFVLIAKPNDALLAAAEHAQKFGYETTILGDDVEGEARDAAQELAQRITAETGSRRVALLSGGEVTVTIEADCAGGYGGSNREFALALALALDPDARVSALIADSDGVDGQIGDNGPVAGAIVDGSTIARAKSLGLHADDCLRRHDSGSFFAKLGDEVVTGPTGTNVNDFRMVLID